MGLRTVGTRLVAEVSQFKGPLAEARRSVSDLRTELDAAAKSGKLDQLANMAAGAGVALVGVAAGAVTMAARFDKAMSSVNAATHASAAEMSKFREAALQAGKDTAFSATEAAQGIEELAKAGVSSADILGGGLSGALSLAAAGEIDVAEAAETAASALVQFGLSGKDVGHVADLLAAGAGKAQGSVRDMSQALNQGGLVAAQMGLSVEEATGTLAAFASAGLMGSDAGTSFKTMLLRLAAPTDVAAAKMKELGINAFDAQGQFIGMSQFAGNLQTALAGLTDEQRNAALSVIFGADAIRSSAIVYQQGQQGIQGWIDKTNDAGYAADTAARKTDNLIGDVERLTGELETLAIQSGSGANQGLRFLTQSAEALVAQFSALPPVVGSSVTVLAGLAGVGLLIFAGWVKARRALADAVLELEKAGPAGQKAATGLQATTKWAGRAAAAFVALEIASAVFAHFRDDAADVDKLGKSLEKLGKSGEVSGELAKFAGDFDKTSKMFRAAQEGWKQDTSRFVESLPVLGDAWRGAAETFAGGSFSKASEDVKALDQALVGLVQAGNLETARAAFVRLLQSSGLAYDELIKLLPEYAEAIRDAEAALDPQAQAQQHAAETAKMLAGGWEAAISQGQTLADVFDELNGKTLGYVDAEIAMEEAIDAATEAIKENGRATNKARTALDLNSEAGRGNAKALRDIIDTTITATQKKYEETGSVEAARRVYEKGRKALIESAIQAGLTKTAATRLADQWMKMPAVVKTSVQTPGLSTALERVRAYKMALDRIPAAVYSTVYVNRMDKGRRWGGITEHAETGLLRDAAVFSAQSPARYAFAEPATGGEAFIPRFGNLERNMAIWSYVGRNWLGMRGMQGGSTVTHVHHIILEGTGVLTGLRKEIRVRGGDVQLVLGS